MMKLKRFLALGLVLIMVLSLVACGSGSEETDTESDPEVEEEVQQGKVLNIWGWNDEFKGLFETYFQGEELVPEGIEVKFTIVPNDDNAYQNALDEALQNQSGAADYEKIDLFLVEADYALKYVDSDYTLNIIDDVGLTPN